MSFTLFTKTDHIARTSNLEPLMKSTNTPRTLLALAALSLLFGTANAAIIYSENFENAVLDSGTGTHNTAKGWRSTLFVSADDLNELSSSDFASHLSGLGEAFGSIYDGRAVTADLGINFVDNTDYTFSFDHFRRNDIDGAGVRAEILTTSGTVLETEDFDAVTGITASDIHNRVVTFTTNGGAEVGQEIRLRFFDRSGTGASSNQAGIDNIQLTAVVIPEPGSLVLLGIASALFGVTCLRKRKA